MTCLFLLFYVLDITHTVIVPCGGPKSLPVHRYSVVIFTFSGPVATVGFNNCIVFGSRDALNPGLGDVRDVIICHEQTQSNSAVFNLWMLYFQRISFSDYLHAKQLV